MRFSGAAIHITCRPELPRADKKRKDVWGGGAYWGTDSHSLARSALQCVAGIFGGKIKKECCGTTTKILEFWRLLRSKGQKLPFDP